MVDFKTLLNKPVTEEAKRQPSLPAGTYNGTVVKWEPGESAQKKTPFVRFFVQLTSPGEDIEAEGLVGISLEKKQMRRDFFLTEDALYRLHEFLGSVGVDFMGRSLGESLPECIGKDVICSITAKMNQTDPTQPPYNEISSMKGVSDE